MSFFFQLVTGTAAADQPNPINPTNPTISTRLTHFPLPSTAQRHWMEVTLETLKQQMLKNALAAADFSGDVDDWHDLLNGIKIKSYIFDFPTDPTRQLNFQILIQEYPSSALKKDLLNILKMYLMKQYPEHRHRDLNRNLDFADFLQCIYDKLGAEDFSACVADILTSVAEHPKRNQKTALLEIFITCISEKLNADDFSKHIINILDAVLDNIKYWRCSQGDPISVFELLIDKTFEKLSMQQSLQNQADLNLAKILEEILEEIREKDNPNDVANYVEQKKALSARTNPTISFEF